MIVDVGNWPGLQDPSITPPVIMASGSPGYVPIQPASTSPSSSPVQNTGTPIPTNVQNDPAASTVLTAGGLLGKVGTIVSNPTQHLFGVFVLLLVGWFLYKGLKHL